MLFSYEAQVTVLMAMIFYCAAVYTLLFCYTVCTGRMFSDQAVDGVPGDCADARTGVQRPTWKCEHVAV